MAGDHIVVRVDQRLDIATNARFMEQDQTGMRTAFSSVLGLVAHTD